MGSHPRYLAWMKNKHIANSHLKSLMKNTFSNSWEEEAWADDAAFIWPPRSYTCSFCKREFRSAQALGGHMNVHRRDRARLKLSSSSQNEQLLPHPNYNLSPNLICNPTFLGLPDSPCIVLNQKVEFGKNARSREEFRLTGEIGKEVNLSIGLNLAVSDHNEGINFKRCKPNVLSMPVFLHPYSKNIDLELRLGDHLPKKQ